jgi:hypothetical protein
MEKNTGISKIIQRMSKEEKKKTKGLVRRHLIGVRPAE